MTENMTNDRPKLEDFNSKSAKDRLMRMVISMEPGTQFTAAGLSDTYNKKYTYSLSSNQVRRLLDPFEGRLYKRVGKDHVHFSSSKVNVYEII